MAVKIKGSDICPQTLIKLLKEQIYFGVKIEPTGFVYLPGYKFCQE